MTGENTVWNDGSIDEQEYLTFKEENSFSIEVKFIDNEPSTGKNQFNTVKYDFEVIDMTDEKLKYFTVTSKRLMRALRTFLPIEGRIFKIVREGTGMEIDYTVTQG